MSTAASRPVTDKASYGIDAPGVPLGLCLGSAALLVLAFVDAAAGAGTLAVLGPLIGGLWLLGSAVVYLHTTRAGKFAVWERLLDDLSLAGDEQVLDLGCGRGAVLLAVARRLPLGRVDGVDLWRTVDQSGNSEEATRRNAGAEGVADRVELHTGDLTALPFADATYDVVVSSLAIHNIRAGPDRDRAIDQAARVLRPGGRLVLVDISHTAAYAARLRRLGLRDVTRRPLGWRFWYGGPWLAAGVVTARRPEVAS